MKGTLMNENTAIVIWVTNCYTKLHDSGKKLGGFSILLIFLRRFPQKNHVSPSHDP